MMRLYIQPWVKQSKKGAILLGMIAIDLVGTLVYSAFILPRTLKHS